MLFPELPNKAVIFNKEKTRMQYYKKLINSILMTAEQYDDLKPKLLKMLYLLLFKEAKPIDDLTIIKRKEKEEKKKRNRTESMGSDSNTSNILNDTALVSDRTYSEDVSSQGDFSEFIDSDEDVRSEEIENF